jgi:hypothetical protein
MSDKKSEITLEKLAEMMMTKFSDMDKKFSDMDKKFSDMDKKFSEIGERVAALEKSSSKSSSSKKNEISPIPEWAKYRSSILKPLSLTASTNYQKKTGTKNHIDLIFADVEKIQKLGTLEVKILILID